MTEEDPERAAEIAKVRESLGFPPEGVPQGLWSYNEDMLA